MIRTGIGYDSHRFGADRPLILGGIVIPHSSGLIGHSDADAVAHALTDAILGAAALGNIGTMFPDTDAQWKDADSMGLLAAAVESVAEVGWMPSQCDITVVVELPKLNPYVDRIRECCAAALKVDIGAVSIKGKTNEGMGFIGRGEGIAVMAVVTLIPTK